MLVLLTAICIFSAVHAVGLDGVSDGQLLNFINTEKYLIVLFTTTGCPNCDYFEKKLGHHREEFKNNMNARVVKAVDSQLLKLYSNSKEPVVVYFRQGIAMLYDGTGLTQSKKLFKEEIDVVLWFIENKTPTVKELTDETFEHLTQASTGATTGDWFVMFYSTDCAQCLRLFARWETVSAKLKQKVNVALVNKATTGVSTATRFGIYSIPQFILFRHGKMYRYDMGAYDIASLTEFAKEWYKHMRPEEIPQAPQLLDEYAKVITIFFNENPWILKLASICLVVLCVVLTAIKFRRSDEPPEDKED